MFKKSLVLYGLMSLMFPCIDRDLFSTFGPKLKWQKTQEITITQGFFPKTRPIFSQKLKISLEMFSVFLQNVSAIYSNPLMGQNINT